MSTLSELFDQQRDPLRQRLSGEHNPEQVVREVKNTLSTLLTIYGQEKTHSLTERRLSGFLLDTVNATVSTLMACETAIADREQSSFSRSSSPPTDRGHLLLRGVQIAIAAVLFGALYQMGAFSSLVLLLALLILNVREWFLKAPVSPAPFLLPAEQPGVHVNVTTLLAKLRDAVRAADTVLADAVKPVPPAASPLESNVALLELFQELLRASLVEDGGFALKQIKTLTFLLEQQGIKVENFTQEDAQLFDVVPNLDSGIQTWLTLKPALVKKDGKLLRRGLAAEPGGSQKCKAPTC